MRAIDLHEGTIACGGPSHVDQSHVGSSKDQFAHRSSTIINYVYLMNTTIEQTITPKTITERTINNFRDPAHDTNNKMTSLNIQPSLNQCCGIGIVEWKQFCGVRIRLHKIVLKIFEH